MNELIEEINRKRQQLVYDMEMYGVKTTFVNGHEVVESGFTNLGNVVEIERFVPLIKGCETWIVGEKLPMRGCFNSKTTTVHQFKKIIPTLVESFDGNIFKKIISGLYILNNWKRYLDFAWRGMRDVYMDNDRYQQPVREIYRLIKDEKTRDVVCAVLEFDDMYRYRAQDVLSELSKKNFNISPRKEIKRLAKIYAEREGYGGFKKINLAIDILLIYLYFCRSMLKLMKEFVNEINLNEIKLSKEDIYWTNKFGSYKYRGLPYEERVKQN